LKLFNFNILKELEVSVSNSDLVEFVHLIYESFYRVEVVPDSDELKLLDHTIGCPYKLTLVNTKHITRFFNVFIKYKVPQMGFIYLKILSASFRKHFENPAHLLERIGIRHYHTNCELARHLFHEYTKCFISLDYSWLGIHDHFFILKGANYLERNNYRKSRK
jgi:hypothetical protein